MLAPPAVTRRRPARPARNVARLALVTVVALAPAAAGALAAAGATTPTASTTQTASATQTASTTQTASAPRLVLGDPLVDVGAPALSNSGRFMAYAAVRRDRTSPPTQLRRLDLSTRASELLNPSVDGGAARGHYSRPPVISGTGSRVAFISDAGRLVAGDTNGVLDAFVRDAGTDTTTLASVADGGGVADGPTGSVSLSRSGRYVVFVSRATDVVPGETAPYRDAYRRDLATGTTTLVSVRPDGTPSQGPGPLTVDVSADGHLVAFSSFDRDLAPGDGDTELDVFVRNLTTGVTRRLSDEAPAGASPDGVVISPDGRWVSSRWTDGSLHLTQVWSGATTTVAPDGSAATGAFSTELARFVYVVRGTPYVRDLTTGMDEPLAVPDGGYVGTVAVAGNGRTVAYDWTPVAGGASRIYTVALG